MNVKFSAATRKTVTGLAGIVVMGWALVMSAYSIYFVTRRLGVPHFFAAGGSLAYDGGAIFSAAKSLQAAQDGRSGIMARLWMAACVALSAFCNALHPILGHESLLSIPYWAGLPIAAAGMFEIHTSQARFKALARIGKHYPAPLPSFGGARWTLFPLDTLNRLRDFSFSQGIGLTDGNGIVSRKLLKEREKAARAALARSPVTGASLPVSRPVPGPATGSVAPGPVGGSIPAPASVAASPVPGPGDARPETSATSTGPSPSVPATNRVASPVPGPVPGPVASSVPGSVPGSVPRLRAARNCEHCGRSFVPKQPHGRFCKDTCRVAWNKAKKKEAS